MVAASKSSPLRPLLTVVVPVYNGGDEIVDNVSAIRRAVVDGLNGEDVETIVVSDGSIDDTAERLLAARGDLGIRVIHYDRNLGKGYAVRAGALASHGVWVALVDADLDLDPVSIPSYLEVARRERLDFAIGSKRHPDSVVHYPRSRRIASWWYQQLNRVLFRLDVRDTQVGLKVFSRRVVEEVMPLEGEPGAIATLDRLAARHPRVEVVLPQPDGHQHRVERRHPEDGGDDPRHRAAALGHRDLDVLRSHAHQHVRRRLTGRQA